MEISRRTMLGVVATGGLASLTVAQVRAASGSEAGTLSLMPDGAKTLKELMDVLDKAPRRRDFKEVPMILTEANQWDFDAFNALLHYKGKVKQVWDHTQLDGPWLNLMRNSLNCQIWSFHHPDFLVVSATHGPAHLALYDAYLWDKYQLAKLTGDKYKENVFLKIPAAAHADPMAVQDEDGAYAPADTNSIPVLQARGVVFLACHNAIFEVCHKLHGSGVNPDKLSVPQMVAEFTNHLIPGAVLTPGIVGTIPEMGLHGFQYAR
ncbi:MAG: transcriptional initiation protein Tat [Ferrovum sp.]|nr:transcriptional initiation protein Tat [Ferrovum sp.]NDU88147.1 transcriptional initiation protein Tat [Ferrovum sp.]